jgi:hypothetical protein
LPELERRAEAISGEFNSQNVANTLWAFATMGTKPGKRMMGQLERRAETISGEFNSQEVANTLWAFACVIHIQCVFNTYHCVVFVIRRFLVSVSDFTTFTKG